MGKSSEEAHPPAVSYIMFRLSGAHTLEQFRRKVAETLACDPYGLSVAQLQKGGWLMTYAIEEAAMRESRSDIDICAAWLEAMLQIASSKPLGKEGSGITPRLVQRAGQLLKLRSEAEMLLCKAAQLKKSGQSGAAIANFSRARMRTKTPLQMSEHRARAYSDVLLDDCKQLLRSGRNSQTFCDRLAAYLSLNLFKATRMHWNFLAIACEGQRRGWINVAQFLQNWRPERLQIGRNHIAEARAALSKVEEILPTVSFRDRVYLEAFLLEAKLAPWEEPLKDTRPEGELDGPFPLKEPSHVVFRARDRRDDVFVHLKTNPHYFYPHFFTFRGQPGPDTLVNLVEVAAFHPVLEHLQNRPKDNAGWWTENLRSACRSLGMVADTLAPKFPADADACGRNLVMLQNTHFERTYGLGTSNSDQLRSISSAMFVASVIKSLQSGKGVEPTDAREWFDYAGRWFGDIHEDQVPFLREIGMTLVRHGFWTPDDTSGALEYRF